MFGRLGTVGRSRRAATMGVLVALVAATAASCATPPPTGEYIDRMYATTEADGLTYGDAPDLWGAEQDLELTLYRPVGAPGPRPAIVFIHSGAFTGGSRTEQAAMAREFAERGYITATITYRLREGTWIWFNSPSDFARGAVQDARHDAQAAVRWLRANADVYGVDPGRIGAVGYSAGAITAIGVGQYPEDPGDSGNPGYSSKICLAVSLSGISVEGPVLPDDAEVLMFHGGSDIIVPTQYARNTAFGAAVSKRLAGYVEYAEVGHTLPHQRGDELMPTMVRTLREWLVERPACV